MSQPKRSSSEGELRVLVLDTARFTKEGCDRVGLGKGWDFRIRRAFYQSGFFVADNRIHSGCLSRNKHMQETKELAEAVGKIREPSCTI